LRAGGGVGVYDIDQEELAPAARQGACGRRHGESCALSEHYSRSMSL
jgi:hypothetical protein